MNYKVLHPLTNKGKLYNPEETIELEPGNAITQILEKEKIIEPVIKPQ